MPQSINKKIFLYFFLFILFTTFNNKNMTLEGLTDIKTIKVTGLGTENNNELLKGLEKYKFENLLIIDKHEISKLVERNNLIEKYTIFKRYPSTLELNAKKTNFLAQISKDNSNYYLGSNGKLIKVEKKYENIPFIFGKLDTKEFLNFLEIMNNSKFSYTMIKNLYYFPSGRWDIETHNGILIKLPKKNLENSINLSFLMLKDDNFSKVKMIDIRQQNQVITNE